MKRRFRKCIGEILSVRKRGRLHQNWMPARGLMSVVGNKTRLENSEGLN